MGTTSDKLTYLNETKTLLKNKINLTGANITTDTFRQYPTKLQNALLDVWNNEGEPIFTNWGTKVNGEGTNVKLDNTINARMKITPKGNTSQTGTPTPSSPIPVNVVSGDNEVVVCGKNLFDKDSNMFLNAYFSSASKITSSSGTKMLYIPIQGGTTYTISKIASTRFRIITTTTLPEANLIGTDFTSNDGGLYITMTPSTGAKYLCVFYYNSGSDTKTEEEIRNSIQIEVGSTKTTYEPYTSQKYNISLGTTELCNIGNYVDFPFKAINGDKYYDTLTQAQKDLLTYGKWYLHKEVGKITLNGSESWQDRPNYSYADRFAIDAFLPTMKRTMYSNYFEVVNGLPNTYPYLQNNDTQLVCNYSAKGTTTLAQFKTWLSENTPNIYYILSNSANTEITDTTLINQLENLKSAMSYEGTTNIDGGFIIIGASALGELD